MKILVTDKIVDEGIDILKGKGYEVDERFGLSPNELLECVGAYDALIVRSATQVTREVIEAATNCKIIGRAGVTCDNIDVDAASEHGIPVCNVPTSNIVSAAEHTMALMLSAAREIPAADAAMHAGKFSRDRFMGHELYEKTLAILVLGALAASLPSAPTRSACALWASTRIARRLAQASSASRCLIPWTKCFHRRFHHGARSPYRRHVPYVCS